ncbi:MAG: alpha/beta fold hydrolase [Actinobacteria bacterium]|nr:MAG: alpha/beta fold hydrolase [Actinomycetota bacterium]
MSPTRSSARVSRSSSTRSPSSSKASRPSAASLSAPPEAGVGELYREEAGEGPAVVLVHEAVCDSRMWDPQWRTFPRSYRTVRYDQRGFGRSPIEPGVFSHARDLVDLLDELGLERTSLVGGSMGGRIALEVAIAHPDRVEKLVLMDPGLPGHAWSEETREGWAEEEAAIEHGDLDAAVEVNLRMWVDGPGRSAADVDPGLRERVGEMQRRALELQMPVGEDAREELLVPDIRERLGDVRAPTLVLTGEEDRDDMQSIADLLVERIPDTRRASIPHAAHVPSLERPDEFDRLVLDFLS